MSGFVMDVEVPMDETSEEYWDYLDMMCDLMCGGIEEDDRTEEPFENFEYAD